MTLEQAKASIGRRVVYVPFAGCDPGQHEIGIITSTNNRFVFVRYGSDINSKATSPEDLQLEQC